MLHEPKLLREVADNCSLLPAQTCLLNSFSQQTSLPEPKSPTSQPIRISLTSNSSQSSVTGTTTTTCEQRVTLTGRNRTVPPCSVCRRTGHAPVPVAADRPRELQTTTDDADRRRRQTTPTDESVQNNTGPLGGPVIMCYIHLDYKPRCRDRTMMNSI